MKAGVGLVVLLAVAMSTTACNGSRHVVSADKASVEHKWAGTDGTTITLQANGSFTADHWPRTSPSGMQYQHYEGTWTISQLTSGGSDEVIIAPAYPIGDLDVETQINLVADGADRYLCVDQDPDSVCSLGTLRAAG